MAFPATILDFRAELLLSGVWTDVTAGNYVYQRAGPAKITRGRPDESSQVVMATADLELNNRDGRFSPRNPLGAYYGSIGRNTQLRISVPEGASYLRSDLDQISYASCPDSAGVSITGDTEIQLDITLSSWRQPAVLAGKFGNAGQISWLLLLRAEGTPQFYWSSDGTNFLPNTAISTVPVPNPPGGTALRRQALKVTYTAASATVNFYTAPDIGGAWTALGSAVVVAGGATSIFDSTAAVSVGYVATTYPLGVYTGYTGKVHGFKLLSGIGGTVKASPDFTSQAAGATSFSDAQSNTWTVAGTAEITDRKYRFYGEVPAWPPKWDPSQTDIYTPVQAAGPLRRLGAGGQTAAPL